MQSIDINCDLGESYGQFRVGNDEAIFPYISSCNIACGFHGGDPLHIENTIKLALQHHVQMGAHPSYPDLSGFGRRNMNLPAAELKAVVKYQIAAVKGLVESQGGKLAHIKAHGALYNTIAKSEKEATAFVEAVREIDLQLAIMGLADSPLEQLVNDSGGQYIREGFLDRRYEANGQLMSRTKKNAVLQSVDAAVEQFELITQHQKVKSESGSEIAVEADSLCIHGDNPIAVDILKAIHQSKSEISIEKFKI